MNFNNEPFWFFCSFSFGVATKRLYLYSLCSNAIVRLVVSAANVEGARNAKVKRHITCQWNDLTTGALA